MHLRTTGWVGALVVLVAAAGCGGSPVTGTGNPFVQTTPLAGGELSGTSYNVVIKDAGETVLMLGSVDFTDQVGDSVSGTWSLEPWGDASRTAVSPGAGTLAGRLVGGQAIVQLKPGSGTESMGLLVEGFRAGRMVGTATILPAKNFDGRFEAIHE
jgi:hypothetical protein